MTTTDFDTELKRVISDDFIAENSNETIVEAVKKAVDKYIIGESEQYTELEYPKTDEEGEPLWSKNAIKENRKQRMAKVVNRKELKAEQRLALWGKIEHGRK